MNKVITLIVALFIYVNTSIAATAVSGQIRTNTTWTKAGSPYICTGLIQVDSFSTLTIEPGTVVDLDVGLIAYKSVIFNYNSTDTTVIKSHGSMSVPTIEMQNPNYTDTIIVKRVKFISTGIIIKWPKSTVIMEECNFKKSDIQWRPTDTQTFFFLKNRCSSQSMLHMSTFVNPPGEKSNARRILIDNNFFDSSEIDVQVQNSQTLEITNSIFRASHVMLKNIVGAWISDNVIYKLSVIDLWPSGKPIRFISNVFFENDVPLLLSGVGDTVEIRNNTMYNNNIAISVNYYYKGPSVAPQASLTPPVLEGNCIYNNNIAGFAWNAKNSINLGANWWGTVDTNKIDSMVYDNKDDFKVGFVNYKPYLTTLNPGCKTYTPPLKAEQLLAHKNDIQVYPNPFLNTLEIKSESLIKSVIIYDFVGKIIYQSTPQSKSMSVNTEGYFNGVYLYRITTDDGTMYTGKVIKQ